MVDLFRRTSRSSRHAERDAKGEASPIVRDVALDVAFYRDFHPDLADYDDEAIIRHWDRHGRAERRAPNAHAAIQGHPNSARLPPDFSPFSYVALNGDLDQSFHNPLTATLHFLGFGLAENRRHAIGPADSTFRAAFLRHVQPSERPTEGRMVWAPRNSLEYLYFHGFTDDSFLEEFDDAFYAQSFGVTPAAIARRFASIFHFAEKGADRLLPIADDLRFDAAFHRRQLARKAIDAGQLDDVRLYRRWLSLNDAETFPPNAAASLKARFGVTCDAGSIVDVKAYRHANADLGHLDEDTLIEHVFSDGLLEQRTSIKITTENVAVFLQHADYLMRSDVAAAEALYKRLIHFVPNYAPLNQHYGDHLLRENNITDAYICYKRSIEDGSAGLWAFFNAATCCERLGDVEGALKTLQAGRRRFPEDQKLRRDTAFTADRFFEDAFSFARAQAMAGRIPEAQQRLLAATALCDEGIESTAPMRAIRTVALFANMDLPQCVLYRVEQKAEQLVAAGYHVQIFDWVRDCDSYHRSLAEVDAVLFYRVAAFPRVIRAINAARAAGLATFYEIDDLVFDTNEFPEPFADYAGQLAWPEYVDVALGVPLFRYAMQLCDYAIASTPALAARMEPLVRRRHAFVHRNALGYRHEQAMVSAPDRTAPNAPVTIFYGSGTKAHKLDFERILLPALEEIDRRLGDAVRFVFAGHRPVSGQSTLYDRIEFAPFIPDVRGYWALASEADISLSVLRSSPTTDAKSEIKWLEAAMFSTPSVVSATQTFAEVIEDGVDGFLAADTAGFVEALALLISDPPRRASVGRAALAKVRRGYGVQALAANLTHIFAAVTKPEKERTRVLVVNVYYAPQAKGGATRVVIDNIREMRELAPDDLEFEVFCTLEGGLEPYSVEVSSDDGVRVTAMVAGSYPEIDLAARDDRAGDAFRRCVERFSPHLIHFHCIQRISASATEIARELGVPYLITVHDGWWICDRQFLFDDDGPPPLYDFDNPLRHRIGSRTGRYDRPAALLPSLRGASAILAVSERFAEIYRSTGLRNVRAVPNGMPRISPTPSRPTPRKPSAHGKVRLAHIGGLEAHKGFPLLKRAWDIAQPHNVTLMAVDLALDPGEEKIELWNGTPIRIVARRHQSAMDALYAEIDVLFAPSLWPESFGLVTREALAAGCWVVASDRGALGEPIEEDVNGHVISVDDPSGLVAALQRIDADPARYRQSPPKRPLRTSEEQAADLIGIYREFARSVRAGEGEQAP